MSWWRIERAHGATFAIEVAAVLAITVPSLSCLFHDGLCRWPLDGPSETHRVEEAGRPRRATGCCAKAAGPERLFMSDPLGLPATRVLPPS